MLQAELHRGCADSVVAPGDLHRAESSGAVSPGRWLRGWLRQGIRQEDARDEVRIAKNTNFSQTLPWITNEFTD